MSSTDVTKAALGGAIETYQPGGFMALNHELDEVQAFIADNLSGQGVNEFDLQRITVPSGKAAKYRWEVPTLEGSTVVDELEGIIVFQKQTRAWWPGKPEETGGSIPPSCSSPDARTGVGKIWATVADPDPAGEPRQQACATCPHSQFGSDASGRGQACKQSAQLFLLRDTGFLPAVVAVPATSLKDLKRYMLGLANAGIRYDQVVTVFALDKKTSGGNEHAVIKPRLGGRLDPEAAAKAKAYGAALRETFEQVAAPPSVTTAVSDKPVKFDAELDVDAA